MKLIYFLALLILVGCSSSNENQIKITDRDKQGLLGKVKIERECIYDAEMKFGEPLKIGSPEFVYINSYNEDGMYIEKTVCSECDSSISRYVYKYEGGRLSEKLYYTDSTTLFCRMVYEKIKDNQVEMQSYNYSGDKTMSSISTYEGGNVVKEEYYDPKGNKTQMFLYEYKEGNLISLVSYGYDGEENFSKTIEYNDKGEIVSSKEKRKITYSSSYSKDGKFREICIKNYDQKSGNEISSVEYNLHDNIKNDILEIEYQYTFDSMGNWIQKLARDKTTNKLISITERNITYY